MTRDNHFEVEIVSGLSDPNFVNWLKVFATSDIAVVTTRTVDELYGAQLRQALSIIGVSPAWLIIPSGESSKTIDTVVEVCKFAVVEGLGRRGTLVAFGGGVCSDIVSFAASMLRRGISHIRIPTTLIGQIDAGIGIKGGVNLGSFKNQLGCFYPPLAVAVAPSLLGTLPRPALKQGLAEIIKIACIKDPVLFEAVERDGHELVAMGFQLPQEAASEIINRAITGMLIELAHNPFETNGYERPVDFGHTISPLLESYSGYTMHHGYAVAVDIAFSCVVAAHLQRLSHNECDRVLNMLESNGLPTDSPKLTSELVNEAFEAAMRHRGGALNFVVPNGLGTASFLNKNEISGHLIDLTLGTLRARQSSSRASFDSVL